MLAQSESERAPVELTRIDRTRSGRQRRLAVSIAQVNESDFVILGTGSEPLAPNEAVELCISRGNGRTIFRCRVLGAYRIGGGGDSRQASGYRLSIPARVNVVNRRKRARARLDGLPPIEVMLQASTGSKKVRGFLRDISVGGARVEVDSSEEIVEGSRFMLFAQLPRPGVALAERVRVVRVDAFRSGRMLLGMAFDADVPALVPFLRHAEAQRSRQARRARSA